MDFDGFCSELKLPLGPVIEIVSITWRNDEGQLATVDPDEYLLKTNGGGGAHVRFRNAYSFPTGLYESDPVTVTWKAGYVTTPATADLPAMSAVPSAIEVAILLMVGHWYEHRTTVEDGNFQELPFAANALLSTYRRRSI